MQHETDAIATAAAIGDHDRHFTPLLSLLRLLLLLMQRMLQCMSVPVPLPWRRQWQPDVIYLVITFIIIAAALAAAAAPC